MKLSLLAILFFTFDISQSRAGTSQPKNPYLKKFEKIEGLEIRIPTFVNRVLIERKTARDLVDSLIDGRLIHQARRLHAAAPRPLLIVE